jgi:hypothetical protein
MLAAIAEKLAERVIEVSIAGLVSVVGWGIWTTVDVAQLKTRSASMEAEVNSNTLHLSDAVTEQRVTNERLAGVIKELQGMREDQRILLSGGRLR